jgi:hypothetical protein
VTDDDDKHYGVYARLHPPPHRVAEAVAEYKGRQEAERAKMTKLREMRLAAEAQAVGKTKLKLKPAGKAKRASVAVRVLRRSTSVHVASRSAETTNIHITRITIMRGIAIVLGLSYWPEW